MVLCSGDVDDVVSAYSEIEFGKSDWKLLFLARSKQIRKIYKKAEKMNNYYTRCDTKEHRRSPKRGTGGALLMSGF